MINHSLLLPAPSASQIANSRRNSGLSQKAMAEVLGLSGQARIAEYESGKRKMPRATWSIWVLMNSPHYAGTLPSKQ